MNSLRTKKKLGAKMTWVLSLVFLCLSVLFFSYSTSDVSYAQDPEPTPTEPEQNYLVEGDAIIVTGVANTIEYLTSLYLYVTDPYSSTSVNMHYDPELNALILNSSINANAMGIGFNEFGEGVVGSVFVGGSGNKIYMRGQEIYDEYGDYTGTRNGKNDSAVAIGGFSNRPSSAGSVIVGGRNNSIGFSDSAMIGSEESGLAGHHSVDLGSKKSGLNVQDWNSINMGVNNWGDKHTYLIGSGINTHGGSHWSAAVGQVFAWSPGASGFALHGGNLGGQPGFYVNVKNGFGLNTSTPRLTFDFRSGGPLRVKPAKGVVNNAMMFEFGAADGIICEDEFAVERFRGVLAYVQKNDVAGFCGCNGKVWMPLSSNALEQSVCGESNTGARFCNGFKDPDPSVILHDETKGQARWDENVNDGKGDWVHLDWTFMGVPSLYSGDVRECSYTCAVGYHPDQKSAKGWFTGSCVKCSELLNGSYITPGTGKDDCEFTCHAGYKYYKWAEDKKDRCTACGNGEWTVTGNQAIECDKCKLPIGVSAKSSFMDAGLTFNGGVMWNGTTGTGEPYFRKFVTHSTSEEYGCNYECASGFVHSFDGTLSGNTCTECAVGTFSKGGKDTTCSPCENRVQNPINFSFIDSFGNPYRDTIAADKASWYTTKGKNGPNSCQWVCNPEIGLVKDGNSCKCPNGSHLELIASKPICVSNYGDLECEGDLPALAIKGPSVMTGVQVGNLNGNDWTPIKAYWKNVNYTTNLKACQWTCPKDYVYDDVTNTCKLPRLGECGSQHGLVVNFNSLNKSDLCKGGSSAVEYNELEFNYFFNEKFQFYPEEIKTNPIRYLATWTCEGFNSDPKYSASCYAYIRGEATQGQCSPNYVGDEVHPQCAPIGNCTPLKNCPPYMHEKEPGTIVVEDLRDNRTPHGWTWKCPGAFGGNPAMCNFCDKDYSWWSTKKGCTKTKIISNCFGTRPSIHNANINDAPYDNIFDDLLSGGLGGYVPGKLFYTRIDDGKSPKNCEYACSEGFHRCDGYYNDCFQYPICANSVHEDEDNTGHYIGECTLGDAGNVTTGEDGKFHYECKNGCHYDPCFKDYYSCVNPIPNTLSAGQTDYLTKEASYELYPSYEAAVASGKPCAVYCDPSYKYDAVEGCKQINCPDDPIPLNATQVDGGWYKNLDELPAEGNKVYATEEEARNNPCGYVCLENYDYVDGNCVCTDCEAAPSCGEPKNRPWNRRSSPQFCDEAYGEGHAEYATCLAKAYNYCDEGNRTGFKEHFTGTLNDRLDYVSWNCERGGVSVPCNSVGCRGGTDNVNPNILCVNSSNSDSIYIDRTNYRIKANGLTGSWQNNYLKLVMGTKVGGVKGQGYVDYYTRAKPNGIVRGDTITFTSNDPRYCAEWKITLVQCRNDLYCDDSDHSWQCCKETEKDEKGEIIGCKNTPGNIKASGTVDYDGKLIDDNGNHIVY